MKEKGDFTEYTLVLIINWNPATFLNKQAGNFR